MAGRHATPIVRWLVVLSGMFCIVEYSALSSAQAATGPTESTTEKPAEIPPQPQEEATGEAPDPDEYFYYSGEKKILLKVDMSRIVFVGAGDQPINPTTDEANAAWEKVKEAHPAVLTRNGIPPDLVKPNDQFHFWEVSVPAHERTPEQYETLVSRLAADEDSHFAGPVFYTADPAHPLLPTRYLLVKFPAKATEDEITLALDEMNIGSLVEMNHRGWVGQCLVLGYARDGFQIIEDMNRVRSHSAIEWIDLAWIISARPALLPNDPGFGLQWGLRNTGQFGGTVGFDIGAPAAWDLALGAGVKVLVLGDGVQRNIPT